MQMGLIGLGRMGVNIARRLLARGHACVGHDRDPVAMGRLAAQGAGAATTRQDLVRQLERPRVVWLMIPASLVDQELAELARTLQTLQRRSVAAILGSGLLVVAAVLYALQAGGPSLFGIPLSAWIAGLGGLWAILAALPRR